MFETAILITCAVFAVAGFVQGLTGFGFGIVAMAILPMAINDFKTAFAITALNSLIIPFITLVSVRKGIHIKDSIPLATAAVVGALLGFLFAHFSVGSLMFIRFFGATLVLFSIVDMVMAKAFNRRMPAWTGWPAGLLGGFFGGAFNTGGPPMVAFCYSQPWSKIQIVATLQIAFITATTFRVIIMAGYGYFDQRIMLLTGAAVVPITIGIYFGGKLLERIPLGWLRTGVFVIIIFLGLQYFLFPGIALK